jgi:hypothetical protein
MTVAARLGRAATAFDRVKQGAGYLPPNCFRNPSATRRRPQSGVSAVPAILPLGQ